jgi:hypothetical protein
VVAPIACTRFVAADEDGTSRLPHSIDEVSVDHAETAVEQDRGVGATAVEPGEELRR